MQEAAELVKAARPCTRSDELALAVQALERRKDEAEHMLRELINPVETYALGGTKRHPQYIYNLNC